MGRPQAKRAGDGKSDRAAAGGLSLDLSLRASGGASKRPGGAGAARQPRRLMDDSGAPTVEGLRLSLDAMAQDLHDKLDRGVAAVLARTSEAEAAVHEMAKADHAKTCQVLHDAQEAMDMAAKQHSSATKQVSQVGRAAAAAVTAAATASADGIRSSRARFEQEVATLRAKAGLRTAK